MTNRIVPVILCGGSGARLWPLSRAGFPKQFLCLTGNESLFQQAATRATDLAKAGYDTCAPLIVSNEEHRFLAREQLREIGIEQATFLLEPSGRNTAPALTLAAMAAMSDDEDFLLVVTPADQSIKDRSAFFDAMQTAIKLAESGSIAILGITPNRPETGYGYIKTNTDGVVLPDTFNVERFVEKPEEATAKRYITEGGYYWNAGMFVLKASVWLKALERFRPDIVAATKLAWEKRGEDGAFVRPGKFEFSNIPSESIDYAVIEHCPNSEFPIGMVPLDAGWSDLGAWDAVWSLLPKDDSGNAYVGDVMAINCHNTLVNATSRLVSVVGVNNLVVIETSDAVLVTDKSKSQDVKNIVNLLNQQKREEYNLHRKVHRPWGWYDSIDDGHHFKVKRIRVNPKASLSLQKHHHRAEHWVVVKGIAEITCGDTVIMLGENQSTFIPLGEVHRLANPGTIPLEIIEVQSGSYLGEDDIVRFEDQYGRMKK